ncbi:hypothetical protein [Candidatus Protofrankia californiensis]|uniref:hypothetical protein n=1 Tax=Candidatus Protofrankia californiensis TaxID=1839754 RepID=UPI003D346F19
MHPLARVRAVRGWSYQRTARIVADRAHVSGINIAAHRQKIWRWEHRGVVPDRSSQLALAAALGVPAERVVACGWPDWLEEADSPTESGEVVRLRRQLAEAHAELGGVVSSTKPTPRS